MFLCTSSRTEEGEGERADARFQFYLSLERVNENVGLKLRVLNFFNFFLDEKDLSGLRAIP